MKETDNAYGKIQEMKVLSYREMMFLPLLYHKSSIYSFLQN